MTITQIECFIEAAKTGSFSKAGANLFISQATISRQIKALEADLGFPLFERKNVGVRLTEMGMILYAEWEELLVRHRTALDKAMDFYTGAQKRIRIGVQGDGKIKDVVREVLLRFAKQSPGLDVEYETMPCSKLLSGLESGEFHVIIMFGSELVHRESLKHMYIDKWQEQTGIVMSKYHNLARKKQVQLRDLKGEHICIMGSAMSMDYKEKIYKLLEKEHILEQLSLHEYQSWSKMEFDLLAGKCIGIFYKSHMLGLEDKLSFYPLDSVETNQKLALVWKDDKYLVKAKNIADLF